MKLRLLIIALIGGSVGLYLTRDFEKPDLQNCPWTELGDLASGAMITSRLGSVVLKPKVVFSGYMHEEKTPQVAILDHEDGPIFIRATSILSIPSWPVVGNSKIDGCQVYKGSRTVILRSAGKLTEIEIEGPSQKAIESVVREVITY